MKEALLVADSGPLIAFARLGRLEVLRNLASRLVVPTAVWREVTMEKPGLADALAIGSASWIEVVSPTQPLLDPVDEALGPGEVEALQLAFEMKEARLLIDELLARREAVRLRLPIIGTVGLLIRAESAGLVPSARDESLKLMQSGYYLSPALFRSLFGESRP
jgi:predicted nucleic acid-binding protein